MHKLSYDRNMVQFYGACLDPPCPMLVLEFMEGGDLQSCILQDCYPTAPEKCAGTTGGGGWPWMWPRAWSSCMSRRCAPSSPDRLVAFLPCKGVCVRCWLQSMKPMLAMFLM